MRITDFRFTVATLGLIGLAVIASTVQEIGSVMSGVLIQLGRCVQGNSICILAHWAVILFGFVVVGIILDLRSRHNQHFEEERETKRRQADFRLEPVREISESFVGLRIFNNEHVDFTERTAELLGFAPINGNLLNLIDMLPFEQRSLDWFEAESKIEAGGHGLIKILTVEWDGIHFYNKNGAFTLVHNVEEAIWKVGVVIRGKLNGNPIIPKMCCISFLIRKDTLDNNRVWWAIGLPALDDGDCNWAKSVSIDEFLTQQRKYEKKKQARWWMS